MAPEPKAFQASTQVTTLRCSIMPDGRLDIVVVIENGGDYAIPFFVGGICDHTDA
jgi:hypothetical protein